MGEEGHTAPNPTSPSSRGLAPLGPTWLVMSRRWPALPVTSRSGPEEFSGSALGRSRPLRARESDPMKKVTSKQSPPRLFGGCAPPRGALVAMDAAAAAAWRARGHGVAGSRGWVPQGHVFSGSRGVWPRLRSGNTMKPLKRESRLRILTSRFLEAAENIKGWLWLPWEPQENPAGVGVLDGSHDRRPERWG